MNDQSSTEVKTFPLSGPINLQCRFGYGSLTIHAVDGLDEARVVITAREDAAATANLTVVMRGPTLAIAGPRPGGGLFDLPMFGRKHSERDALDVEVTVPTGTAMKIGTFATDITIDGQAGSTVIRSGRGGIDISAASGPIDIATGSGDVTVGVARGSVRLRSGSSRTVVHEAHQDVDLLSGAGSLTVGLPPGRHARLDVEAAHGQLRTEMPVVSSAPAEGQAPLTIRARTGRGDVTIRRTPAEPLAG